jgi:hypothetical protein
MRKISATNRACRKCGGLHPFYDDTGGIDVHNVDYHAQEFLLDYFRHVPVIAFPDLRYKGMKHPDYNPDNTIESGIVFVEAVFRTISGMLIRSEFPLLIREGRFLTPSVMYFGDTPQIISASVINEKIEAGTFQVPWLPREMLSGPLEPQVRFWIEDLPANQKTTLVQRWDIFDGPR